MNEIEKDDGLLEYRKLHGLLAALNVDVIHFTGQVDLDGNPVSKRAYVRAVFAAIEGITYGLKNAALDVAQYSFVELSESDVAMIKELVPALNDKGVAIEQDAKITFLQNTKFAFSIYAKAGNFKFALPAGDKGWGQVQAAQKIRNRLAHPKTADDLNVDETEIETVTAAFNWFIQQFTQLSMIGVARVSAAMRDFREKMADKTIVKRSPDGGVPSELAMDLYRNCRRSPREDYVREEVERWGEALEVKVEYLGEYSK